MQQTSLIKDGNYIFNSLERLAKGTCENRKHDICTWDLMPIVHNALKEHIAYEETNYFAQLSREERHQHKLEHDKLHHLLARISYEFECGYGEQLPTLIRRLIDALKEHLDTLSLHLRDTPEKAS